MQKQFMNDTDLSYDKKSELTELTEGHESEENGESMSE